MKLSIIIVNYNVRHFLENCLHSVKAAVKGLDAEVIVVDNASSDDSPVMMQEKFPKVSYIYLEENVGFSRGNNVGIKQAKGEYILLLNPDTVVQEDTFKKCIDFMESHPKAGGLGVKMIDGAGHFLPESKRGFPTPKVAFYKVFGLSSIFPKSKRFGQYHLGYLNNDETHKVDVLSGAFMMMRKAALDKVGLLDEDYFMYGEDIDLSYRIVKGGFENYYFPEATIIHYKGESTKKGSINYVFVFYRAMIIFAKKHLEPSQASLFSVLINLAIYFRAFLAMLRRIIGRFWKFIIDFLITYAVFARATTFYESYGDKDFSLPFISLLIPVYAFILTTVLHYSGAHDSPFKFSRLFRGWLIGIVLLLAIYALLPEGYRFSRAVILLGALGALTAGAIWRWVAAALPKSGFKIGSPFPKRRIVVGNEGSLHRVKALLEPTNIPNDFLAGVSTDNSRPSGFIATVNNLGSAIKEFSCEELIIDSQVIGYNKSIDLIENLNNSALEIKLLNDNWIIGPNQVIQAHRFKAGNQLYQLNLQSFMRLKRTYDVICAIILFVLSPLLLVFIDQKGGFFRNIFQVLNGSKSWISYDLRGNDRSLPQIKPGVLYPNMNVIWPDNREEQAFEANVRYLKSTPFLTDLQLTLQHIHNLGN